MKVKEVVIEPGLFDPVYILEDGTRVTAHDSNYEEVAKKYAEQNELKRCLEGYYFQPLKNISAVKPLKECNGSWPVPTDQVKPIINGMDSMSAVTSTFDKQFNTLNNAANMFANVELPEDYTNQCCQITSAFASVREVEELKKDVTNLDLEVNKKIETMKDKVEWGNICMYLTWAMLIILGFMIYFKSFDVSIEVKNPVKNQEIELKHNQN